METSPTFSYGKLLLIQVVILILVPVLFLLIPSKLIAALIAACFFICVSLGPVVLLGPRFKSLTFWGTGIFLVFFAIPILGLRLSDLDADFNTLYFMGISGKTWHQFSTPAYGVMVALTFIDFLVQRKKRLLL